MTVENAVIRAAKSQVAARKKRLRRYKNDIVRLEEYIEQEEAAIVSEEDALRAYVATLSTSSGASAERPRRQSVFRRSPSEWDKAFREFVIQRGTNGAVFTREDVMEHFHISLHVVNKILNRARRGDNPLIKKVGRIPKKGPGADPVAFAYNEEGRNLGPIGSPGHDEVAATAATTRGTPVALADLSQSMPAEIRAVIRKSLESGATLIKTGKHYKLTQQGKQPVVISATPSDHRSMKNLKTHMRRSGFPL